MHRSSPNRIIWQYFDALRRLVDSLDHSEGEPARQDSALCIMLAVTIVEAFLNVYARVTVSEPKFAQHEQRVLSDLTKWKSLDYKLRKWPKVIFGKALDPTSPTVSAFFKLKDRRNALMHFTSSHETMQLTGISIQGLANTSALDALTQTDAASALKVAEDMIAELLRVSGIPECKIFQALHLWTGRVPT